MWSTITRDKVQLPAETPPNTDFQTDAVTISVKLCNLPPFSAIASQVLSLTSDADIELRRISDVIKGDTAFAADILFLANSSLFGFPSRMHSLRHAIALLGLDRIKALAVTVAMRAFLGQPNPLILQCWQHSVACALVCEELAPVFDISGDRAYTAGIMHDVGRLGLLKTYPKEMTPVLTALHENAQEVLQAERAALNVDHGLAGSWLVKSWALPQDFREVCERHHEEPKLRDSEILQLARVACVTADLLGFPAVQCRCVPSYREAMQPLMPRLGRKKVIPEEDMRVHVIARLAAFQF